MQFRGLTYQRALLVGRTSVIRSRTMSDTAKCTAAPALPERFSLQDKNIVVTGAGKGIGLEFTKQLLAKGNFVIAATRNPDASTALKELKAANADALRLMSLDVAELDDIQAWGSKLAETVDHVDVVINNAGIARWASIDDVRPEDMIDCYKVASITENEGGSNYAYRCSKIAANMATKSMSIDLAGKGITSTILHPGYVRTAMTNGKGLLDTVESVDGMLTVLQDGRPLNGRWYHTSGRELPW